MDRMKINMLGGGFQHSVSTNDMEPKLIEWVKDGSAPISIHIDNGLHIPTNPNTRNYGWLCESKTIISAHYDWCKRNIEILKNNFIKVFTHDVQNTTWTNLIGGTYSAVKNLVAKRH